MQIALVGWQGGGKSTLFTALTGSPASIGDEAHPGVATLPDETLDQLHDLYPPSKKINAKVTYVDVAGLSAGQKQSGIKRSLVNHLQSSNVLVPVIGIFHLIGESVEDIAGEIKSQLDDLEIEMLLSDLVIAENRIERMDADKGRSIKIDNIEYDALQKALAALNDDKPLRRVEFTESEDKTLRGMAFLTKKPLLVVINHGEGQETEAIEAAVRDDIVSDNKLLVSVNGSLEAEIAVLDEEDREMFLEEMGLTKPVSARVINASFDLLGLVRFFTVGDDECRSWPIPKDMIAVDAAGEIHSDLSRGFIRAEVVSCTNLLELGSLSACRDKGLLRLEGKNYAVQDGDIMHIRFAV